MNQFGKLLRQERKERNMTLGDLAVLLGISVPYLSQIETGAKPLRGDFVEKAVHKLGLLGDDANALRRAGAVSMSEYAIRLKGGASNDDRVLASMLATGFAKLSPGKKQQLRDIMKDESRG